MNVEVYGMYPLVWVPSIFGSEVPLLQGTWILFVHS